MAIDLCRYPAGSDWLLIGVKVKSSFEVVVVVVVLVGLRRSRSWRSKVEVGPDEIGSRANGTRQSRVQLPRVKA